MATHSNHDEHLDPETKAYNDFMREGNDYVKIELYLYAIKRFQQALLLKPNESIPTERIAFCKSKFQKDNKTIAVVVAAAIIVVSLFIFL